MFAYEYKFVLSKSSLVPLLSTALEDPRRGGGGGWTGVQTPLLYLWVFLIHCREGGWIGVQIPFISPVGFWTS